MPTEEHKVINLADKITKMGFPKLAEIGKEYLFNGNPKIMDLGNSQLKFLDNTGKIIPVDIDSEESIKTDIADLLTQIETEEKTAKEGAKKGAEESKDEIRLKEHTAIKRREDAITIQEIALDYIKDETGTVTDIDKLKKNLIKYKISLDLKEDESVAAQYGSRYKDKEIRESSKFLQALRETKFELQEENGFQDALGRFNQGIKLLQTKEDIHKYLPLFSVVCIGGPLSYNKALNDELDKKLFTKDIDNITFSNTKKVKNRSNQYKYIAFFKYIKLYHSEDLEKFKYVLLGPGGSNPTIIIIKHDDSVVGFELKKNDKVVNNVRDAYDYIDRSLERDPDTVTYNYTLTVDDFPNIKRLLRISSGGTRKKKKKYRRKKTLKQKQKQKLKKRKYSRKIKRRLSKKMR